MCHPTFQTGVCSHWFSSFIILHNTNTIQDIPTSQRSRPSDSDGFNSHPFSSLVHTPVPQQPNLLLAPFKAELHLTRRKEAIGIPPTSSISHKESPVKISYASSPDTQFLCTHCERRAHEHSSLSCSTLASPSLDSPVAGSGWFSFLLPGAPEHLSIHLPAINRSVISSDLGLTWMPTTS